MQRYDFPTHHKGDWFNQIDFAVKTKDPAFPELPRQIKDLTGYTVKMQVRFNNRSGNVAAEFSSGNGINIYDPANGLVRFEGQEINLRSGTFWYEVQFTSPEGHNKTYFGGTWIITEDGTR